MIWHILWVVGWMVSSAVVIDIARAAIHRRRPWAGLTVDAEARRLEREKERAPFLPEAQREVDAMFWETSPLTREEKPAAERPTLHPHPTLAIVADDEFPAARWISMRTEALVAHYWQILVAGSRVPVSLRGELAIRLGWKAVLKAEEKAGRGRGRPVYDSPYQPPPDPDDEPVVIDGKTLPAPNDKRWAIGTSGDSLWFWMPNICRGLAVYPDGDVRLSHHGTWFKHKAAAVLCKKVLARLKPEAEEKASAAMIAVIKNVEAAARKKKV